MGKIMKALENRGFVVKNVSTAKKAEEYLLSAIDEKAIVGVGGSTTVTDMNLRETLRQRGNKVLFHSEMPQEERHHVFVDIMSADAYLCSANAISEDGRLWMIDGTGNRLSAVCYGPKNVYFICGKNKLVQGGEEEARIRMKHFSNPLNCKRLNLDTPCAKQGKCPFSTGTYGPKCICNFTLEIGRAPENRNFTILLVDEELGY